MKKYGVPLFVVLCVLFWIVGEYTVSHLNPIESDFFSYWLAGHMVWFHQYPYAALEWINGHTLFGAHWISDPTFLYPLPLAFVFAPLGLMSPYSAFVFFIWFSLFMLLGALLLLLPLFGSARKHYVLPIITGVILFRPFFTLFGHLGALLLIMVVLVALLWERSRWVAGSILLSLTALKTNIGIPLIVLLVIYLLVNKKYRAFIGMGVAGIGLILAGMVYRPQWVLDYLQILQNKNAQVFGYSPTLWGVSALTCRFNSACTTYLGGLSTLILVAIFVFVLVRLRGLTPWFAVGAATALALAITPYLWATDQILLVLPIILTMVLIKKQWSYYLISALYFLVVDVLGFFLLGFSIRLQIENLNGILSLFVFGMLVLLLLWQSRETSRQAPLPDGSEAV